MSININGAVAFTPENHVSVTHHATLTFVLEGGAGWPFEVRVDFGKGPEAMLSAAAYACRIRKGDHVRVEAAGVTPRSDHGLAVNVLRGISRVDVRGETECFVVPGLLR